MALSGELLPPLAQLLQADHLCLVGVEQPGVGAAQPLEARHQPPLGPPLPGRIPVHLRGEVLKVGDQPLGIGEQVADVAPDRPIQGLAVHAGARARLCPAGPDAVPTAAPVVAPPASRRWPGCAVHGQPAAAAGQQAAQQVVAPRVVAEREDGVAGQLRLGAVPDLLPDQRWDRDRDPLLLGSQPAAAPAAAARPATAARLRRCHVLVAVRVGGASVDRVGEDVVDGPGRPGPTAAARKPGTGVQALEDPPQRQPLLGQPAVEHAHHLGLGLVDNQLAGRPVVARQATVAVRGVHADELPGAGFLQLAAAEPLTQQCPLVLGDRPLDLQQELVAGVIGDGAVEERDGAAGAAELLQEQDLVGVLAGQAVGGEDAEDLDLAVAHAIAQGVEAGPVEAGAAAALVPEHVVVVQVVTLGLGPGAQGGELAVDGLLALLALGRDASVDGGAHGSSLSGGRGAERSAGWWPARRR